MAQAITEDAAGRRLASIASCTGWGLQRKPVTRNPGELLPRLSILTGPEIHPNRRFISVALSLESPPPAVSRHPCPAVPGLSSYLAARDRLFTSHPRYLTLKGRDLSMPLFPGSAAADSCAGSDLRQRRLPAGNTATALLKLIALAFMLIDHSGKVLFNNMEEMRTLGRIAFPIYVWCMIVGFERTRSVPKYLLRLLIVGAVSQPLYLLALDYERHIGLLLKSVAENRNFFEIVGFIYKKPNIFLTLVLGLSALWGIREKKWLSQIWAPAIALALATLLNADYGWKGVLLFILVYAARYKRGAIAAVMVAFFMYWGTSYPLMTTLFGINLDTSGLPAFLSSPLKAFPRKETFALLALPFILIPFPRDIKMPRWVGYALYPAHLVLLIMLKIMVYGW